MAETERDDNLRELLRQWTVPEPSEGLDRRVLKGYRRITTPPVWRRVLHARLPAPVAAVLVALAFIAGLAVHAFIEQPPAPITARVATASLDGFEPVSAPELKVVRQ